MSKRKRRRRRDPIFAKRQFADEVILLCVRWYLRFKLSYRDLSRIMHDLGIAVAPCTILRWVVRYSIELSQCCQQYQKSVARALLIRGKPRCNRTPWENLLCSPSSCHNWLLKTTDHTFAPLLKYH